MRSYRLPDLASPGGDSLLLGFLSGVADMVLDSSPEQQPEASSNVRLKNRGLKEQGLKPQETASNVSNMTGNDMALVPRVEPARASKFERTLTDGPRVTLRRHVES